MRRTWKLLKNLKPHSQKGKAEIAGAAVLIRAIKFGSRTMLRGKQVCDKGEQDNGESRVLFFAPEKWKFPIPSAYNTGRVILSKPVQKGMIIK